MFNHANLLIIFSTFFIGYELNGLVATNANVRLVDLKSTTSFTYIAILSKFKQHNEKLFPIK